MAQTMTSDSFRGVSRAWQTSSVRSALVIWRTLVASRSRVSQRYVVLRTSAVPGWSPNRKLAETRVRHDRSSLCVIQEERPEDSNSVNSVHLSAVPRNEPSPRSRALRRILGQLRYNR
jgi:hypothetical protein